LTDHRNNWDVRYDEARFFYGRSPNEFVGRELQDLPPGHGLYLAEGEGRNAVFAAGLGHQVTAVDSSVVGRRKALELAAHRRVSLKYDVADLLDHPWPAQQWDHVVMCFAHLPPETMPAVHAKVVDCLAPGGTLIHVSFAKSQFGRKSGGPPRLEWLHEVEVLKQQYAGLDLMLEEKEVDLQEAVGHRGPAMVIELTGTKAE